MKKIIIFFIGIILLGINNTYSNNGYIESDYNIGDYNYNIKFKNEFQKNVFELRQINDIKDFIGLLNTTDLTKYSYKYVLGGVNLSDIHIKKKIILNKNTYNGKGFTYFLKKYGDNEKNLDGSSYLINEIIYNNIPYNGGVNHQVIRLIEQEVINKFNELIDYKENIDSSIEQEIAEEVYNFYSGKLSILDTFNYKLINELIGKINSSRGDYLIKNNYIDNKNKLNSDKEKILDLINSKYSNSIYSNFEKIFIENNSLDISEKISQGSLNNIEAYFVTRKRNYGDGDIRFLNDISGLLNNGDILNKNSKNFFISKLNNTYNIVLGKIELLNSYEISLDGTNQSSENEDIISNISENGGIIDELTGSSSLINGEYNIIDEIDDISLITSEEINTLYKTELKLSKQRDLSYIGNNIAYNKIEENFLNQSILDNNILDEILNGNELLKGIDLLLDLENELSTTNSEDLISDNINIDYDIENDSSKSIYNKIYKRQMILNMNNPVLGSDYVIQPISSLVIDDNSFKNSIKNTTSNSLFLESYRTSFEIDNIEGMYENDLDNNSGISGISFSYNPSPIIIKNNDEKNIGIELGNKKTYYLNDSHSIELKKGNYDINLYSLNDSFENIKLFFNGNSINIDGLLNVNSNYGIDVKFSQDNNETNFLPTLWINSVIK